MIAVVVALAMVIGCGGGGANDTAETAGVAAVPASTLPVGADAKNAYPIGQEWRQTVGWGVPADFYRDGFRLYQSSIAVCMESRGFDYLQAPWYDDDVVAVVVNPLNRSAAETYGYHLPPFGASNQSSQNDDSTEFQSAINGGAGETGCGDIALGYAYGGTLEGAAEQFDFIVNEVSTVIAGFGGTGEGLELLAEWSSCMDDQGYDYRTPDDPLREFSGDEKVGEKEIRVRLADLQCDTDVGLTQARSRYETKLFEEWLDLNAEIVNGYETSLANAKAEISARRARLDSDGVRALDLSPS